MAAPVRMLMTVILVYVFIISYSYMHDPSSEDPRDKYLPEFQQDVIADKTSERPILIWWTGRLFIRREMSVLKCGDVECAVTKKRRYLKDPRTRALIFYGTDFSPEDLPLPRRPHHEWALTHEESPMNNYMLSHAIFLRNFNHSSTFKRESHMPITTHSLESLDYLTIRPPVDTKTKNQYRKEGLAPILFVQSHCNVASDRDNYIRELMKHIRVDSYGACVHNKDLPERLRDPVEGMFNEQFLDIIAQYKFHLAFENAICDDFVTEKLFRVFHVGSVPVYKGASTARDFIPDREAIIMADDFESPAQLAYFINELDQDDERYEKYLEYKRTGVTNDYLISVIMNRDWGLNHETLPFFFDRFECHVCEKVNERLKAEKEGRNLPPSIVPYSHIGCPQPVPSVEGGENPKEPFVNWTMDYWSSLNRARAMQIMMERGETDSSRFHYYWDEVLKEMHRV